jgi:uncharacterized protein (UPF0548 family)
MLTRAPLRRSAVSTEPIMERLFPALLARGSAVPTRPRARPLSALLLALCLPACASQGDTRARGGARPLASEQTAALAAFPSGRAVLHVGDGPALFARGSRLTRPVGFVRDANLRIVRVGPSGIADVVVEGALEVRAEARVDALALRVQRRGQLRGTPVFLAPGDVVQVVGPGEKPERLRVRAAPRVGGLARTAHEGTYPVTGLAADPPPPTAAGPEPGARFELAPRTPLTLRDRAGGTTSAVVPAGEAALPVEVLFEEAGFRAVRVGEGPYLVGFTDAQLSPASAVAKATGEEASSAGVPRALAREPGELVRVSVGTELSFDGQPLARFRRQGYARVLTRFDNGEVDVFAAVDDQVAVRGLVRADRLSP